MRESANIHARLHALRQALETQFMEVWNTALREMRYRFPLLIVDEAPSLQATAIELDGQ